MIPLTIESKNNLLNIGDRIVIPCNVENNYNDRNNNYSNGHTWQVGLKQHNVLNLYDMIGNVWDEIRLKKENFQTNAFRIHLKKLRKGEKINCT